MGAGVAGSLALVDMLPPELADSGAGRIVVLFALVGIGTVIYAVAIDRLSVIKLGELRAAIRSG